MTLAGNEQRITRGQGGIWYRRGSANTARKVGWPTSSRTDRRGNPGPAWREQRQQVSRRSGPAVEDRARAFEVPGRSGCRIADGRGLPLRVDSRQNRRASSIWLVELVHRDPQSPACDGIPVASAEQAVVTTATRPPSGASAATLSPTLSVVPSALALACRSRCRQPARR